jgi:hypothetical protein
MANVQIKIPDSSGSVYFNYKGIFSIVLLRVANANHNFIYADVGCQGQISDGGVFKYTSLYEKIEQGKLNLPAEEALPGMTNPVPFVFVADDAFALATHIMKPYPGYKPGASSPERILNYRLNRARRITENVFGIVSSKFSVLLKPIALQPVESVVLSYIYLHNLLHRNSVSRGFYTPSGSFDLEDTDGNPIPGLWRSEVDETNSLILYWICKTSLNEYLQMYIQFEMNFETTLYLLKEQFLGKTTFPET